MFLIVTAIAHSDYWNKRLDVSIRPDIKCAAISGAFWYHFWQTVRKRIIENCMVNRQKSAFNISENEFVLLQNGSRTAFRIAYDTYYSLVQYICKRFGLSAQSVDDITQETFIKLYSRAAEIKSAAQVKAWLASTTRNACIDQIRAQKRTVVGIESSETYGEPQIDTSRESAEREQEFNIVSEFIEEITNEPGGDTFVMFYRDGLSAKAIADRKNESVSSVTTRLTRLRRKFADILRKRIEDSRENS